MEKFLHSDVDKFALSIFVKIRINIWKSSISLDEGTTELILENNSLRHSSDLGHFKMKCISSSGSILQKGHIIFSTGSFEFTHVWVNQGTFSKSKLLHSLSIKLEDRYTCINHWKKLLSSLRKGFSWYE
jgi:hypothetical protein